jgi:thioredoxin 1
MEITQKELREKIDSGEKMIVDFWAPWCGPCKMMKPIFERVAETSDVPMYTINVDENREIALELGVRAIPTIKTFNEGGEVSSKAGLLQESQLKDLINTLTNG